MRRYLRPEINLLDKETIEKVIIEGKEILEGLGFFRAYPKTPAAQNVIQAHAK